MSRKKGNPLVVVSILVGLVLVLGLVGGAAFMYLNGANQFSKLAAFPVDNYMDSAGLWSQQDYRLEGRVDNIIAYTNDKGSVLLSMQPKGSDRRVPVVVQAVNAGKPLQREQDVVLKVTLGNQKQIICSDYSLR